MLNILLFSCLPKTEIGSGVIINRCLSRKLFLADGNKSDRVYNPYGVKQIELNYYKSIF
ncbi:MAG: hypothetical protein KKD86_03365 [Bacteroidetes bacterium]|nr:hypothetical protein [Bacteroidota bacterium]